MTDQSGQYGSAPPPPSGPAYGQAGGYGPGAGAVGKPRGIGVSILLAIVTLGIYTFVWTWKTHDEIKRNSGNGVGGPLGFVIYFVVSPVTFFLLPSEVNQMLTRAGRTSRVRGITGLWILLPLIGTIVWFVKVQGQLNEYWRSLGATG
jgi:cytosine/uracil/thiamine/allantoin permease